MTYFIEVVWPVLSQVGRFVIQVGLLAFVIYTALQYLHGTLIRRIRGRHDADEATVGHQRPREKGDRGVSLVHDERGRGGSCERERAENPRVRPAPRAALGHAEERSRDRDGQQRATERIDRLSARTDVCATENAESTPGRWSGSIETSSRKRDAT